MAVATIAAAGVALASGDADSHRGSGAGAKSPERIILVVIDTLRRDHVSAYGGKTPTPNIDALAASGQRFEEAFASFHQTTMSMASVFTGHTPSLESGDAAAPLAFNGRNWCGLRRFADDAEDPACVPASVETLAEKVREAGYWTLGISSNALMFRPAGFDQGFDRWIELGAQREDGVAQVFGIGDVGARGAGHVHQATLAALRQRPSDRLFLYVHYMDVHDYEFRRESYAKGVMRADRALGRLLAALAAEGLTEDAVVIVTSDHGERLGEQHLVEGMPQHRGNPSFEELLRIPLVMSPAVTSDAGRYTRTEDLHRLILRVAGVAAAKREVGPEPELFTSEARYQTYRKGRFKSYRRRSDGALWLVDLAADPGETKNASAAHPHVAGAHRSRMNELTQGLAAGDATPSQLTEEDRARLRSLGYLE